MGVTDPTYEPALRDLLREEAVHVVRQSGPKYRTVARAFGVAPNTVGQWATQRATHSPVFHELRHTYQEAVRVLAENENTNPWELIAAKAHVVLLAWAEHKDTDWLIRRAWDLSDAEHDLQAAEDRASQQRICRHDHDTRVQYRRALRTEGVDQWELAAIDEVLEARGVDWLEYDADGRA